MLQHKLLTRGQMACSCDFFGFSKIPSRTNILRFPFISRYVPCILGPCEDAPMLFVIM